MCVYISIYIYVIRCYVILDYVAVARPLFRR